MGFHNLSFRTFVHATEDEERVRAALRNLVGDADIVASKTEGYHGNPIIILEARLNRNQDIRAFFEKISEDQIDEVISTLDERMDDEGCVFLRLDKQQAFIGVLRLAYNDDVISVRGKVESYPKRREIAMRNARDFLESLIKRPRPDAYGQ